MAMTDLAGPAQASDLHAYVDRELRRGVEPDRLSAHLTAKGIGEPALRAAMGPALDGRRPASDADHDALARPVMIRRAEAEPTLQRVATRKAQVYTWKNFLDPETCRALIELIDTRLRASDTVDAFADPEVRTSRTSDIGGLGHPLVQAVEEKISRGLGLHWSYSDVTQAQRYDVKQEYKAHYDYFAPGTPQHRVHAQTRGQRTWTFMIYLNDVEAGGGTRFRRLERTFMPQAGRAVVWNNLYPDGRVNPNTIHHGMKVRAGVKYIITKWFRERGWGPMFLDTDLGA